MCTLVNFLFFDNVFSFSYCKYLCSFAICIIALICFFIFPYFNPALPFPFLIGWFVLILYYLHSQITISVFVFTCAFFLKKKQESFLMQNKILFTDQCLAFYSAHGRLVYTFWFREKDQGFTVPEALFPSASTRTSNHSGAGFSLKILSLTSIFWP